MNPAALTPKPVTVAPLMAAGVSESTGVPGRTDRVRLVFADDDPALRFALRALLALVEGVEIVGEAEDGDRAVELACSTGADVVLLDVNMPRMDGVTAAEAILRYRPQTSVILHTAEPSERVARRAQALGVPLLSKMGYDRLLDEIARMPVQPDNESVAVEPLVLAALAGKTTAGAVVAGPDGDVRFYNGIAAELLGLPLPPVAMTLEELRGYYTPEDAQGQAVAPADRPFMRVFANRQRAHGTISVPRGGRRLHLSVDVVPFFDDEDELIGAAAYLHPIAAV